jgi:hypothetical protein
VERQKRHSSRTAAQNERAWMALSCSIPDHGGHAMSKASNRSSALPVPVSSWRRSRMHIPQVRQQLLRPKFCSHDAYTKIRHLERSSQGTPQVWIWEVMSRSPPADSEWMTGKQEIILLGTSSRRSASLRGSLSGDGRISLTRLSAQNSSASSGIC